MFDYGGAASADHFMTTNQASLVAHHHQRSSQMLDTSSHAARTSRHTPLTRVSKNGFLPVVPETTILTDTTNTSFVIGNNKSSVTTTVTNETEPRRSDTFITSTHDTAAIQFNEGIWHSSPEAREVIVSTELLQPLLPYYYHCYLLVFASRVLPLPSCSLQWPR